MRPLFPFFYFAGRPAGGESKAGSSYDLQQTLSKRALKKMADRLFMLMFVAA